VEFEMSDYEEGYEGSQAASPKREPEKDDGVEIVPWEHWEKQQEEAVAWFKVEE
jgi:hypothetical protein